MVERLSELGGVPFPVEFNCPNCGSSKRLLETIAENKSAKGEKGIEGISLPTQAVLLADPTKAVLSAELLMPLKDYCMECGMEYTYRIEATRQAIQMQPGQHGGKMPPFNLPPGMRGN